MLKELCYLSVIILTIFVYILGHAGVLPLNDISVQLKLAENNTSLDVPRTHYAPDGDNLIVYGRIVSVDSDGPSRHKFIFADGSELSFGAQYGRLIVECGKDFNVTVTRDGGIKYEVAEQTLGSLENEQPIR
jgi:hypothetical protein